MAVQSVWKVVSAGERICAAVSGNRPMIDMS